MSKEVKSSENGEMSTLHFCESKGITIKELYKIAKENELENFEIYIPHIGIGGDELLIQPMSEGDIKFKNKEEKYIIIMPR